MKKIFLALMLSSFVAAAEPVSKPVSLGFGAGPTYGAGFVFRYDWEKWGIQVTDLPLYTPSSALFVEGVTGFYTLNRGHYGRLYLSGGAALYNRMTQTIQYIVSSPVKEGDPPATTDTIVTKTWDSGFAVGPGVGIQLGFWDNMSFSFEMPVAVIFDTSVKVKFDSIRPYPNAAILYSF